MGKVRNEPMPLTKEQFDEIRNQMKKCLSQVKIKNEKYGTAFFCKIPFPDLTHLLPVLIAHTFILNKDDIAKGKIIEFTMEESKLFKLSLDINRITYFVKNIILQLLK